MLDREREVVDAFAQAVAAVRPDLGAARLQKPLAMLLFGMMNWMFTWLRPGGALSHAEMMPIVAELFFGGLAAVEPPTRRARPGTAATADNAATAAVAACRPR